MRWFEFGGGLPYLTWSHAKGLRQLDFRNFPISTSIKGPVKCVTLFIPRPSLRLPFFVVVVLRRLHRPSSSSSFIIFIILRRRCLRCRRCLRPSLSLSSSFVVVVVVVFVVVLCCRCCPLSSSSSLSFVVHCHSCRRRCPSLSMLSVVIYCPCVLLFSCQLAYVVD